MMATANPPAPVQARPKAKPGPWDGVEVTLYTGSYDNQGQVVRLGEARRVVRTGDHELYAKNLGRITVQEYTGHIRARRQEWIEARYEPKQIKAQFDELKKLLPAVTWSGRFVMARKAELLTEHSGMIAADVDGLTAAEIESKWQSLAADPHFWLVFLSPSETGLKVVVPVSGLKEHWPLRADMIQPEYAAVANQFQYAAYFTLRKYMAETHGLRIEWGVQGLQPPLLPAPRRPGIFQPAGPGPGGRLVRGCRAAD